MKFFTEMFYDTQAGVFEIHFQRAESLSARVYEIAVLIGRDKTFNFKMNEEDGVWKIDDKSQLPGWIIDFEDLLSDSICAHIARSAVLH